MNKLISNTLINGLYMFIGTLFAKIFEIIIKILISRNYGTLNLGNYTLLITILSILTIITMVGLESGIKYFSTKYRYLKQHIYKSSFLLLLLTISFITILITILLLYFPSIIKDIHHLLYISIILLPFYIFSKYLIIILEIEISSLYRSLYDKFIRFLLMLITLLLFIKEGFQFYTFLYSLIFINIFIFTSLFIFSFKYLKFRAYKLNKKISRNLIIYSLPLAIHYFVYQLLTDIDLFIIKYLRTSFEVGLYSAANTFPKLIPFLLMSIAPVLLINMLKSSKNKNYKSIKFYQQITNILSTITFPIFVFFVFFSKHILSLFGNNYNSIYILVVILSIGYYIDVLIGPIDIYLNSLNLNKYVLLNSLIALSINILLNIILINFIGIIGIAIATSISIIIQNTMGIWELYKKKKIFIFNINTYLNLSFLIISLIIFIIFQSIFLTFEIEILFYIIFIIFYILMLYKHTFKNILELKFIFKK